MATLTETKQKSNQKAAEAEAPANEETKATEKSKYSKEELLRIFDEMIFSSEYIEDATIKGKLKVTFRSRSVEDTTAISKAVEAQDFKMLSTLSEYRALQNLAYSLVKYNGRDLSKTSPEERLKFLNSLPAVIVSSLSDTLNKFDQKMVEACQEGEANF